jgi:hypothetical protein
VLLWLLSQGRRQQQTSMHVPILSLASRAEAGQSSDFTSSCTASQQATTGNTIDVPLLFLLPATSAQFRRWRKR